MGIQTSHAVCTENVSLKCTCINTNFYLFLNIIFQLFENLKPSKVVILSSAPACEYHTSTPENLKADFVRVLKTDSWQEKIAHRDCSFLETPNIISGVAASGTVRSLSLQSFLLYLLRQANIKCSSVTLVKLF